MKFVNRYGVLDRTLHRLAFKTASIQVKLSNIEFEQYEDALNDIAIESPVFIISLPRAGTTLLLDLCVASGEFATHDYSDMPFILLPLFWSKYSSLLRGGEKKSIERAHADGVKIDIDTAEAFEEVLWKTYWPEKYLHDRIIPWRDGEQNEKFDTAFKQHIQKQVFLKRKKYPAATRYISKNNANIARSGYLDRVFPEGVQVLLFRDPVLHAQSLLKQHTQFVQMHQEDPFSLEYMQGIGHHDFGLALKCLDIDDWISKTETEFKPDQLDFWLLYWCSAYGAMLKHDNSKRISFCFEALYKNPQHSLQVLAERLLLKNADALVSQASKIREPGFKGRDQINASSALIDRADSIYDQLCSCAINY